MQSTSSSLNKRVCSLQDIRIWPCLSRHQVGKGSFR